MAARKLRTVRPDGTDPDPGEATADGHDGQAARGVSENRRKRSGAPAVRYTVEISEELDFRLSGVAKFRRMRKNALMREMIEMGCARYKIDGALKIAWAESSGQNVAVA